MLHGEPKGGVRLELVTQAELKLALGTIRRTFSSYFSEGTTRRIDRRICTSACCLSWVVEIRMVDEVVSLRFEVDVMAFEYRERLLQSNVPALEARSIDLVASLAWSKCSCSRFLEDAWAEPIVVIGVVWRGLPVHL